MHDKKGFDILHNGVPRTFRDTKATAYDAARYAKSKARGDIIEIVDRSTGAKLCWRMAMALTVAVPMLGLFGWGCLALAGIVSAYRLRRKHEPPTKAPGNGGK